MLGKRLINTGGGATPAPSCTTDTLQILGDTSCKAYYKMSDATDESDNYDGTPSNVNFNVSGKFGNAGEFNGSSSKIDIASIITGNNSFCVSMWLNPTAVNGSPFMMGSAVSGDAFLTYITSSNQLNLGRWGDSLGSTSNGSVPLNTWTHIAISSNAGSVTVYVNGASDLTFSTQYDISSNGTFFGYASTGNQYYNGSIDNVRIFNKALSSSEVTTLNDEVYCQPTIVPTEHFTPISYTGNGGTQSTNSLDSQAGSLDFSPGLVWIKSRTNAYDHNLYDTVRGADGQGGATDKVLTTNKSNAQEQGLGDVTITGSGFTVTETTGSSSSSEVNLNNANYISWNWYAPTAQSIGASGSRIASTIKKNVDAGFSIVQYSGAGTLNIGHGLDSVPNLIITKGASATEDWYIYNSENGTGKYLSFTRNDDGGGAGNDAINSNANTFSAVTDTTFTHRVTSASLTYIAYCFKSVDGMSRVGSYLGTGAAGNSIVTGFRPAFVMVKRTDGTGHWLMFDNKRGGTNEAMLRANTSDSEFSGNRIDFNSNGFTLVDGDPTRNASGGTYIFLAIAEEGLPYVTRNATNPFGDSSEVALYKFEDNATDAEGNHSSTTLPNVTFATGYIDKAAVFNGSNAKIETTADFAGSTATGATISFWFKTSTTSGQTILGSQTANPTTHNYGSHIYLGNAFSAISDESIAFINERANFTETFLVREGHTAYSDGVWHHAVFVSTNSTKKIYIDGISKAVSYYQSGSATAQADLIDISFGTAKGSGSFFNGQLDQVRIFNRALDSGEALQLYNE